MSETKYELLVITNDCEETFDLEKTPGEKTELVKEQKKQLSAELDLRRLIVNLDNTATLLYISYNALSGTSVQSKVSGLQKQLSDLCAQSQVAMSSISSNTEIVFGQLPTVYKLLVNGRAPAAMKLLASCSIYAGKMAETSEKLAAGFEKMGDKAQEALEGSQDLYADDLKKKEEITNQINDMRAKQAKLKKQSEELQGELQEIEEKYADAQKREENAEKNQFIMGIVNICTSTLTMGLSSIVERNKSQQETQQTMQESREEEQQKESRKKLEKEQKELEDEEKAVHEAEKELTQAEEELSKLKAEEAETDEAKQEDYSKKKEDARQKVEELKDKVEEAKKSAETKREAVAATQAALQSLSEQLTKEREEMKSTLEKAQATTSELFKVKLDMQKENREIAGEMAEIAEMLKGQQELMVSTDKAVEMLKLAIRCLGNIVVAFTETALFWRSIEQGCKNLQDGSFMMQVKTFAEFDSELQSMMYEGEDFRKAILMYMATWVALHAISVDYYAASQAVGTKVRKYIGKNLFGKEAFEEASRLADEIIESMQEEQQSIDESNAIIEKIRLGISDGGQ